MTASAPDKDDLALRAEMKTRMPEFIHALQDEICRGLEALDGTGRFREDTWKREGGGGGRTRVLEGGSVFEKAGVNTSVVHGELPEAFAKKLQGDGRSFFASGISLVLHPSNPMVPTVHANYRFFEQGSKTWFGGGADLTPSYLFDEDAEHFHRVHRDACLRHPGVADFQKFKKRCDEYFVIKHRGETRGVGGIFFENEPGSLRDQFAMVQDLGRSFLPAYLPIAERRKGMGYGDRERNWKEVRRGRYVEFNLVYDRGTLFGLETGGRIESILMSLPAHAQWRYDYQPDPGTEEARLVEVLRHPRDWVAPTVA